jgi:hypothetical protein
MDFISELRSSTLVVGLLAMLVAVNLFTSLQRGSASRLGWRLRQSKIHSRRELAGPSQIRDSVDQLRDVMSASFERRRVMAYEEYKVFQVVEAEVSTRRGHRVFAQTSLGEILASKDSRAFSAVNSKRVDILVVDSGGYPLVAVEYQGKGHYQGSAAARDAVKKEALRKAGVQYLEVSEAHSNDEIRNLLRSALGTLPTATAPTSPETLTEFGRRRAGMNAKS